MTVKSLPSQLHSPISLLHFEDESVQVKTASSANFVPSTSRRRDHGRQPRLSLPALPETPEKSRDPCQAVVCSAISDALRARDREFFSEDFHVGRGKGNVPIDQTIDPPTIQHALALLFPFLSSCAFLTLSSLIRDASIWLTKADRVAHDPFFPDRM